MKTFAQESYSRGVTVNAVDSNHAIAGEIAVERNVLIRVGENSTSLNAACCNQSCCKNRKLCFNHLNKF